MHINNTNNCLQCGDSTREYYQTIVPCGTYGIPEKYVTLLSHTLSGVIQLHTTVIYFIYS